MWMNIGSILKICKIRLIIIVYHYNKLSLHKTLQSFIITRHIHNAHVVVNHAAILQYIYIHKHIIGIIDVNDFDIFSPFIGNIKR